LSLPDWGCGMTLIRVSPHAVDRYIERSGKEGLSREGALREILSPRVVDAAASGSGHYYDRWTGLTYVIDSGKVVTVLPKRKFR
jgi:hypothetical protein